jgi:hypothetical protein
MDANDIIVNKEAATNGCSNSCSCSCNTVLRHVEQRNNASVKKRRQYAMTMAVINGVAEVMW